MPDTLCCALVVHSTFLKIVLAQSVKKVITPGDACDRHDFFRAAFPIVFHHTYSLLWSIHRVLLSVSCQAHVSKKGWWYQYEI